MFRMSSSAYVAVAFLVAGCSGGGTESPVIPDNTGAALSNYAEIVHASYVDSLTSAEDLEAKINTFVTTPTEANLTAAEATKSIIAPTSSPSASCSTSC